MDIDPVSADLILDRLLKAEEYSDIGLLQLICSTPDMYTLFVGNKENHYLERFVLEHEGELWIDFPYDEAGRIFQGFEDCDGPLRLEQRNSRSHHM